MKTDSGHLVRLDRAVLALLDERVRLVSAEKETPADAEVEDLLRRHNGPFPAAVVRRVFAAIEEGCRP